VAKLENPPYPFCGSTPYYCISLSNVKSAGSLRIIFYFFSLLLDPLDLFDILIPNISLGIFNEKLLNYAIYSLSYSLTYE